MISKSQELASEPRQVSLQAITFLLFAVLVSTVAIHFRSIGGDFLCDDFVHAEWIANAQAKGVLLEWLVQRFYQPLDSGNYAYRPVVFASYALDWYWHGIHAAGWHFTNIAIHVANGFLMMVLAWRMAIRAGFMDPRFVGVAAATLLLAIPFAGESTYWPVGRFDLLACMFSLIFLIQLLSASSSSGIRYISVLLGSLLLALLSKESAIPIVAVGFILVFAFSFADLCDKEVKIGVILITAINYSLRRYWPVIAFALAYFAWREFVFGSPWKVYPNSQFPLNPAEFWSRIVTLKYAFVQPYAENILAWRGMISTLLVVWLYGISGALKRASIAAIPLIIALLGCVLLYLLAPATSFPIVSANGEGIRNLYLPWAIFSLFAGFVIAHHRVRLMLLCVMLVISFWGQWRLVSIWQDAAAEMLRMTSAIPVLASTINPAQYALILLPDHLGAVPFMRNAQGGIVGPPRQSISFLPRMAPMTQLQFAEWEKHLASNKIGKLKGHGIVFDRAFFSGVYCWIPTLGRFQLLDAKPIPNDATRWEAATMKEVVIKGCLM